jgi:serine/threonine protein kinase
MRRLKHPNICEFYRVFDYKTYIAIAMEYVQGETLSLKIKNKSISSENLALEYTQKILEGLSYMHSVNIVHRDIKPSNIMFSTYVDEESGQYTEKLKIIDFGLCGDLNDKSHDSLIHDKCGTLGYLAPELVGKKLKT